MINHVVSTLNIPRPVFFAVMGVYGILIVASLLVMWLKARGKRQPELAARVKSWWVMVTVFAFAVFAYQPLSAVFLAFISYLALKEYFSIIPTRRIDRVVLLACYLAVPVTPVFMHGLGKALPKGTWLLVPYVCDVFVGVAVPWRDDSKRFMAELEAAVDGLEAQGHFSPWE